MSFFRPRLRNPVTPFAPIRPYAGSSQIIASGQARLPSTTVVSGGGWQGWSRCGWGGCWGPPWGVPYLYPYPYPVVEVQELEALPVSSCPPPPIVAGHLAIDEGWAATCFWPAYADARDQWGNNATAIATTVLLAVMPDAALGVPSTGPEHELRRRIELAVAVLLSAEGTPVRMPRNPPSPRPLRASQIVTPWIRALVTGWI